MKRKMKKKIISNEKKTTKTNEKMEITKSKKM